MRGALLFALGIVVGVLGTLLWPKSTFEQCMLEKIHDPKRLDGAYWLCKGHPRKPPSPRG
jgi:hypothetical protein